MDPKLIAAARAAFPKQGACITLGAPVYAGECHPEPLVTLPCDSVADTRCEQGRGDGEARACNDEA